MAKINRSRYRSAAYASSVGHVVTTANGFSISAKGFSWTFSHNWKNWGTYAQSTKKRMTTILRKRISEVAQFIALEAIKRCPHYSGALEKAIRVSEPEVTSITYRGRIEFAIGVLSNWHSGYDDTVIPSLKQLKYYPTYSGPELASLLHEQYDTFIGNTEYGYQRKLRKQEYWGVTVGSHFLTRAYTENRDYIRNLISSRLSPQFVDSSSAGGNLVGRINAILQQAAVSYNPKGTP